MKSGRLLAVHALGADRAHQVHAHGVPAEREEQRVAQAEDARVPPHEVHGDGDDRVAGELADERDEEVRRRAAALVSDVATLSSGTTTPDDEDDGPATHEFQWPAAGDAASALRQRGGLRRALMRSPRSGPWARRGPAAASG